MVGWRARAVPPWPDLNPTMAALRPSVLRPAPLGRRRACPGCLPWTVARREPPMYLLLSAAAHRTQPWSRPAAMLCGGFTGHAPSIYPGPGPSPSPPSRHATARDRPRDLVQLFSRPPPSHLPPPGLPQAARRPRFPQSPPTAPTSESSHPGQREPEHRTGEDLSTRLPPRDLSSDGPRLAPLHSSSWPLP